MCLLLTLTLTLTLTPRNPLTPLPLTLTPVPPQRASRGALSDHAALHIRPSLGQKRGEMNASMAKRFRTQVLSLGLDVQKDTGFNEKVVTLTLS